ncbi:MAG: response regulator [Thermodesulfobacteriota bacterium]
MPVVTITSGAFCQAEEVAPGVARELGCQLIDDAALIAQVAGQAPFSVAKLRKALYEKPGVFNNFSHEKERCLAWLKLGLGRLLNESETVLWGLTAMLTPADVSHALRVCLIADARSRAKAAAGAGLGEQEALAKVHKEDEAAYLLAESLRRRGPWEADFYDILIPMDKTSAAQAIALICQHARGRQLRTTPESLAAAADFMTAARLELALLEKGHNTRDLAVSVKAGEALVAVNKKVLMLGRLEEELKRLIAGVEGVKSVRTEVGPGYYQADVYMKADFELPSKVLLVDDEREFVQTLSERLLMRDIGSAVVYDGEQALSLVDQDEPEVVVLDLKMPGIDGIEVLRRLKRDHPDVEVIILTGHGSAKDRQTCLDLGAFAYLEKPVDIDQLSHAMREANEKIKGRRG